jgi:DNA-binding PadR family transcriptional regulator
MELSNLVTETLILSTISKQPLHLYGLILKLSKDTGIGFSLGSVQGTLIRLEKDHYIVSVKEGHKRVFGITDTGRCLMRVRVSQLERINEAVRC